MISKYKPYEIPQENLNGTAISYDNKPIHIGDTVYHIYGNMALIVTEVRNNLVGLRNTAQPDKTAAVCKANMLTHTPPLQAFKPIGEFKSIEYTEEPDDSLERKYLILKSVIN